MTLTHICITWIYLPRTNYFYKHLFSFICPLVCNGILQVKLAPFPVVNLLLHHTFGNLPSMRQKFHGLGMSILIEPFFVIWSIFVLFSDLVFTCFFLIKSNCCCFILKFVYWICWENITFWIRAASCSDFSIFCKQSFCMKKILPFIIISHLKTTAPAIVSLWPRLVYDFNSLFKYKPDT